MKSIMVLLLVSWALSEPTTTDSLSLSSADSALMAGDYEMAIRIYKWNLQGDPISYRALFGLARAIAFSGKRDEAIQAFSDLLDLYPNDPDALLARGRVFAWEGRFEEAEDDLQFVTEKYPEYTDAWSALGDVYLWSGDADKATTTYSRWVELQPDESASYIARAKAYQSARLFSQARKDLQAARMRGGDKKVIGQLVRNLDRIPGATPWEGFLSYAFRSFSPDRPNWQTYSPSLRRDLPNGSVRLIILRTTRFSMWDGLVALDSYFDLWQRSYGNFYFQSSVNPEFLPKLVLSAEIFQGVGKGWEISASYRNMRWSGKPVNIYGESVARYIGSWYIRERTTFVPDSDGFSLSVSGFVRRYFSMVDNFVEIGVGSGKRLEISNVGAELENSDLFISVRAENFVTSRLGLVLSASYNNRENVSSLSFSLGIKRRW